MEEKKQPMPPLRATIRFQAYPNEIWKEFKPEGARRRYMASNLGRIASFYDDLYKDGYILKVSNGHPVSGAKIGLKIYKKGTKLGVRGQPISEITNISYPVHKIIAELFLEQPDEDHDCIIHLDHDKFNNEVSNLRWVTKKESWAHQKLAPYYKPPKKGRKLTPERVRLIKKKILEGKTKQSLLAKQFGLSEMGIYRIKTGKLWADIVV
ncbi:MAG: HNH endonuclease [Emticicia sp.]|uniref:HNH endonuclease n=1 Tax=Emticicia sp. TaxID=1930953 RepID=UPI003BA507B0